MGAQQARLDGKHLVGSGGEGQSIFNFVYFHLVK